ncbi:hypothetical protein ADL01_26710, partial [Streptomyces sp. NRRL WC-3618]|uniref:hypothetical protein n=1 Tax=Streptomyces sp. NRRL WC-3618 TaxID=1519490 RepID=UPI0006BEBFB4
MALTRDEEPNEYRLAVILAFTGAGLPPPNPRPPRNLPPPAKTQPARQAKKDDGPQKREKADADKPARPKK